MPLCRSTMNRTNRRRHQIERVARKHRTSASLIRKMRAVVRQSWQGGPLARPRCIPRPMTRIGIEPSAASADRFAGQSLALSWSFPAPPAPNHGGPLWPVQRHSARSLRAPRDPMANRSPVGCRQRLAAGLRAGRFRSPCTAHYSCGELIQKKHNRNLLS